MYTQICLEASIPCRRGTLQHALLRLNERWTLRENAKYSFAIGCRLSAIEHLRSHDTLKEQSDGLMSAFEKPYYCHNIGEIIWMSENP